MDQYEDNQYHKFSSGRECNHEQNTEKCYCPNYFTKTMQYVDPRQRYRILENSYCSNESIALQRNENSPLPKVKITPNRRHLTPQLMPRYSTMQETSLTQNMDTEVMVQKIQNMFPTAGENHIRLLLKKYYNREAVVISALQVEKHPVTMPGPYVTPPAKRNVFHNTPSSSSSLTGCRYTASGSIHDRDLISLSYSNSRSASPAQYYDLTNNERKTLGLDVNQLSLFSSAKATSKYPKEDVRNKTKINPSPKMKLRYMKAIFPVAEETLIFDVLANADNNVQKATEKLISIGYTKRNPAAEKKAEIQQNSPNIEKPFILEIHSREEKDFLKKKLSEKYSCIADHILLMALESVNYDEERAKKILQIVQEEEAELQNAHNNFSERSNDSQSTSKEIKNRDMEISQSSKENEYVPSNHEYDANDLNLNDKTLSFPFKSSSFSSSSTPSTSPASLASSPFMPTIHLLDALKRNSSNVNSYLRSTSTTSISTSFWKILTTNPRIKIPHSKNSKDSTIEVLSRTSKPEENPKLPNNGQRIKYRSLAKGPNESLLLADYVIWNGANPDYHKGQKCIPAGANAALRSKRTCKPCGHNPKLCNGPQPNLARGRAIN